MQLIDTVEIIFSLGLFINAVLFIPQIIRLYKTKNSQGISLVTFGGFSIIQFFTVLHAYLHQDILLLLGFLLSLITCGIVTFLIIFYRCK